VLRSCPAALLPILLVAASATAGLIHVDHEGGGDYLTISEGIDAAASGDTVLVAPGTYTGPLNRGIDVPEGVVLMSDGGSDLTVVDCGGSDYAFYVRGGLHGFTIRGGNGFVNDGYTAVYARFATISDCVFTDNPGTGVLTYFDNLITDCTFLDHGATSVVVQPGGQTILSGCVFRNHTGPGLGIYDEWYGGGHLPHTVLGCSFLGVAGYSLMAWWESPVVEECLFVGGGGPVFRLNSSTASISYCTVVSNQSISEGIFQFSAEGHSGAYNNCTVRNCIVAFNSCTDLVQGPLGGSTLDLSCFFGNAGGDSLPVSISNRSNIFEDPLFCDVLGGDYALCSNSPCLAENEPLGIAMGAHTDGSGCGSCVSPADRTSWGAIKALYRKPR